MTPPILTPVTIEDPTVDGALITTSGEMSASAASDWIDIPEALHTLAVHAVTEGGASWEVGNHDKSIVRTLTLTDLVNNPTSGNVGIILRDAIPGGGASLRLKDTSGATNEWTVWIKYASY